MRVAVGSMVIIILTEHQVGWAEWTVAKWAGSSLAKTIWHKAAVFVFVQGTGH